MHVDDGMRTGQRIFDGGKKRVLNLLKGLEHRPLVGNTVDYKSVMHILITGNVNKSYRCDSFTFRGVGIPVSQIAFEPLAEACG